MVWFYQTRSHEVYTALDSAFNPTMVWFYRQNCRTNDAPKHVFQSHYGLILSVCKPDPPRDKNRFQSHYGLILSS